MVLMQSWSREVPSLVATSFMLPSLPFRNAKNRDVPKRPESGLRYGMPCQRRRAGKVPVLTSLLRRRLPSLDGGEAVDEVQDIERQIVMDEVAHHNLQHNRESQGHPPGQERGQRKARHHGERVRQGI